MVVTIRIKLGAPRPQRAPAIRIETAADIPEEEHAARVRQMIKDDNISGRPLYNAQESFTADCDV